MQVKAAASALERLYPRIYFACHRRHVRDRRTGVVLSAHAASVLDHLDREEPTSVTGLAEHMGVTVSTMSLTLDRLESAALVTRQRDTKDARRARVLLTDRGVALRAAASVLDPELVERLMRALAPAQRESAIAGLKLLADAAAATAHDARAGRRGTEEDSQ